MVMKQTVPHSLAVGAGRSGELLRAVGPWILDGVRVYCLDAGNVFDPLPLARWLTGQGGDARLALERSIFVSRAYTCHQLATAARRLLAPLAQRATRAEPCLALITGIEAMFLDEDLPLFERRYLFERTLQEAGLLARAGVPVLITHGDGRANDWTRRLSAHARPLRGVESILPELKE